ncbi:hypothetical protein [Nonomuraea glycinis]|uniref:hypothetical protein n=1 Tax=Nonomuraea glycinis TaxID=2047744 RepID=UPI0033AA609D
MTYFQKPEPIEAVRLEALKLATEHAPIGMPVEQIVAEAARYEQYILEGKQQ